MDTDNSNDQVSRRAFLEVSSAALAAAVGALSASSAVAQNQNKSRNASGDRTKSDPGPANPALDGQNADSIWPLLTAAQRQSVFNFDVRDSTRTWARPESPSDKTFECKSPWALMFWQRVCCCR
jgi:hypothetical protein